LKFTEIAKSHAFKSVKLKFYEKAIIDKRKINTSKNRYVTRERIHLKICIPNLNRIKTIGRKILVIIVFKNTVLRKNYLLI